MTAASPAQLLMEGICFECERMKPQTPLDNCPAAECLRAICLTGGLSISINTCKDFVLRKDDVAATS